MSFLVGLVCANRASADARASNWPIRVVRRGRLKTQGGVVKVGKGVNWISTDCLN